MSRQATCDRGGEVSLSELVDARVDRNLDEQRGSPLVAARTSAIVSGRRS